MFRYGCNLRRRSEYYGPTNMDAYDFIDAELAKQLPSYPENVEKSLLMNFEWWNDHLAEGVKRFEAWLQS